MELSERIYLWRKAAKLSQAKLARLVGVSPAAVSYWENDKATPGTTNLEAIAEACGVSMAKFWGTPPAEKRAS